MNNSTQTDADNSASREIPMASPPSNGFFSYQGRIGRMDFFWAGLLSCFIAVVAGTGTAILIPNKNIELALFIAIPLTFLALYVGFVAGVKRCHDLDQSGWLYWLVCIPIVGFVFGLYLLFAKGKGRPNQYGIPPGSDHEAERNPPASLLATVGSRKNQDVTPKIRHAALTEQDASPLLLGFDEEAAYTEIAHELESKRMDKGLWLKAMVQTARGDERQQAIVYSSLRLKKLQEAYLAMPTVNNNATEKVALEQAPEQVIIPRYLSKQDKVLLPVSHAHDSVSVVDGPSSKQAENKFAVAFIFVAILVISALFLYANNFGKGQSTLVDNESKVITSAVQPALAAPTQAPAVIADQGSKSDFSFLLGPPPQNVGQPWYECSKDLIDRFQPSCYTVNEYCSDKEYQPKISKLSSRKTQYGINYVLLVTRKNSPTTNGFRSLFSCHISKAGEVISLDESR